VFDDDSLEVVIAGKEEQQTENAFVGGRNRWRYDTFVNWELWWPGFPILVYFKVRSSHRVAVNALCLQETHYVLKAPFSLHVQRLPVTVVVLSVRLPFAPRRRD
jgi:hypothetical protein